MIHRLDRFEIKFVITREQRTALMAELEPHLQPDGNGSSGGAYPIVSLYYDNAARDCYWERVRGVTSRRKLRVRVYGNLEGTVLPAAFLEVKQKCDGRVVKRRMPMPLESALRAAAGEPVHAVLGFAERRLVGEVQQLVRDRGFFPTCCMRYERHAWAGRDADSDLRITFDQAIGYRMDDLTPAPDDRKFSRYLLRDGQSVMEIKVTGAVPYWLTRLLGEKGCMLSSHSKYCSAIEAAGRALAMVA